MSEINIAHPHEYDHRHADISSGWLRATVFGAMDGLVSNVGLIAGIAAAGASPGMVAITGVSGLIAGAVSMALGEFTSVRTANEQLDAEVRTEQDAHRRNPQGEQAELALMFEKLGMQEDTARIAAGEVHTSGDHAVRVHLSHELGMSEDERPSPWIAAVSSLLSFSVGALIPILPFLFGFGTLGWGLAFGGLGLLLAGALAARITRRSWIAGAIRQLTFGGIAVAATFTIGKLLGVSGVV
ncbi:putative membrane protein [Leucobacter sp. 7(1)]|uniref:VIT1/CCC1 transporter family protein n=1 Tax=Leucobacter sp. 7(1) TaxID=1255613 RepID=UPI00097F6A36|nr:VIT1/CCC1 transporter family protein [Leucobacter sp. 7(1)]SJN09838.1 putative membrane protein [Leucobacter sp. 7(1)]